MLRIKPFRAVRPDPTYAPSVASLPYDVVNTEEARQLAGDNPNSFLHVVRSEIDLPQGTNPYDDAVYEKARENFDAMRQRGVLVQDEQPRLYLYRQVMNHRPQVGLVCCCNIDDYLRNVIKKHEKTRQQKEDDRTKHTLALNANAGPVFLTYEDRQEIDALVRQDLNDRPLYHFDADDGVTHSVWQVKEPQRYVDAFANVDVAYVADGHHRSASAARAGAERRKQNPEHTGEEEYNWFLTVLFPASQLTILPYNRVVTDFGDRSPDDVKADLAAVGEFKLTEQTAPDRPGSFCLYMDGRWHKLIIDPATIDHDDPIASLDAALLDERVLGPVFGIGDIRVDPRVDFVGGIRGSEELERRVDSGDAAVGISLHPVTIQQLMAVADAGLIMPPKSTWFEPKLRSGLLVHMLD